MQPDLPWNVAGIPSEAREAARAAARREGLPVGEWLTRRILRSFGDLADISTGRGVPANATAGSYRSGEGSVAISTTARETEEMLARVSRSENESQNVYRLLEEQLKGMARRLEAAERTQTENSRAMSKAASEINIAAREQAQAFDQLGAHVMNLNERLQRVERTAANDGMREAVKALHQGLSRLADQISQTASQSATQVASLAENIESLAGRLNETRQQSEALGHTVDERLVAMDDRVRAVERSAHLSASSFERAMENFDEFHAARRNADEELRRQSATLSHVTETLERINARLSASEGLTDRIARIEDSIETRLSASEAQTAGAIARLEESVNGRLSSSEAQTAGSIARLEESVSRMEMRGSDPSVERRLVGIETTLSDIAGRLDIAERREPHSQIDEELRALTMRMDAADKRQRESFAELGVAVRELTAKLEAPPSVAPAQPAAAAPEPAPEAANFDLPPFPEMEPAAFAPPAAEPAAEPAAPVGQPYDPLQFFAEHEPPAVAAPLDNPFAPPAPDMAAREESFLAAARRSARAAATVETEVPSSGSGFNWGLGNAAAAATTEKPNAMRFVLMGGIVLLVVIAVAAGVMLSRNLNQPAAQVNTPAPHSQVAKGHHAPVAHPEPLRSSSNKEPSAEIEIAAPAQAPAISHSAAHEAHAPKAAATPAKSQRAKTAPVKTAALTPLQRIAVLANGGSANGELLLGLAYLDGQGTPVNEAEGARWLERAAAQGNAVAAYRLGTLYERGHGVPANIEKANRYYMAAAKAGNRKGMYDIGVAYAQGSGFKKDFAQAAQWFLRAANLGLADAQFNLAVLYERGLGVPQSLTEAYKWYAIAAAQGDTESKNRVETLATQITPDQKVDAERAALAFRPQPMKREANNPPDVSAVTGG